ncbi:MAG: hypothetical protein RMK97_07965 [Sutterellaceae bacterium]|nr:hypothetical protein [Burkholderiaceae bacterium]MDW8430419.1 hypothetical protein [Sutterellaceae bacterium]
MAAGLAPLVGIDSYDSSGLDPEITGLPVPASRNARARAGWNASNLYRLKISAAFTAQACAVHHDISGDTDKVSINDGTMASGHPMGAQRPHPGVVTVCMKYGFATHARACRAVHPRRHERAIPVER